MTAPALDLFAREIAALLAPVAAGLQNPKSLQRLLAEIGVLASDDPSLIASLTAIGEFETQLKDVVAQSEFSFETINDVLELSGRAFALISTLADAGSPVEALQSLGQDLAGLLVAAWLANMHPLAHEVAVLLTFVQPADDQAFRPVRTSNGEVIRAPFRIDRFRLGRLVDLLRDPVAVLRGEYVNALLTDADAAAIADKLFPRVHGLLSKLGVSCRYGTSADDEGRLGDSAALMAHSFIIYADDLLSGASAEAGLVLNISPASRGDLGLVISPFGALSFTRQVGAWSVELQATAGVDAVAWGRHGPTLLVGATTTDVTARATATLDAEGEGPAYVLGSPDATRLEIGGVRLNLESLLSEARQSLSLSADVSHAAFVIPPVDGDGFLSSLLPAHGLRADFDLGLAWSSDKGLTLRGSAGLEATLPIGLSVAGVTLSNIHLVLQAREERASTEVSASLSASIGPVQASIERVGLSAALSFPTTGGNLGVADLTLGLKPPSGVGLSIDAHGVLTGGGFLVHDAASGTYAGVMQLSLHDQITLTAYGLIATKMPDGSRGYSLLIFITAEGFKPIPLGFGFMLQAIGGMVGVHRTFDANVIAAGLKSDTLSTLLFPRDPVANAPAVIQALATAFPARQGSYLLGLVARITWFTPTLVQLDLALILEFGARTRLLALGRVSALLPSRDNDLIRLNMDALGVLDFDAGTLGVDAVLVDSRLAQQFPITGSAALRARWAGDANFVLAVGGLNPRFAPPTGFPSLERVAIALCSGKNPRLICDAYLAITSNTVQFGSRVSLYAEAIGFSIAGDLGFDALVTLLPPHFIIDFHAAVQLKRGSHNLFKVTLDGTLEGPLPLRLSARAKFEILWFSFSVHFDFTLAAGNAAQALPSAVALSSELRKALADPASWSTRRSPTLAHGVVLRSLPPGVALVLDPLGQLVVQQQVVPLNTARDIDTYGGLAVTGPGRFHLAAALNETAGTPLAAAFAPARYFAMSDDDKLVAPSFEMMDSGLLLGDETVLIDAATIVPAPLKYAPVTLNPPASAGAAGVAGAAAAASAPLRYALPVAALAAQRPSGASARVPLRRVGRARFRNPAAAPAASLATPGWRLVQASDGAIAPIDPALTTWSEHRAALATLNRGGARWLMVPEHELAQR